MNLQENIRRIREMIGVITEENNDSKKLYTIQVSSPVESKNSIGVLVDLVFDKNGRNTSASNLKWFPKSLCTIERIEPVDRKKELPTYFLTAPKWLIDKNIDK
jgi:hypothetical protein